MAVQSTTVTGRFSLDVQMPLDYPASDDPRASLDTSSRASFDCGAGISANSSRRVSLDGALPFDINTPPFNSDHFRMYRMKIERCPKSRPHDWTQCPFLHNGEKAKRRDPRKFAYSATACADFRKSGLCARGDACTFAHGVFECWLHPARYRTQLCTDGLGCKRRVCFFAHQESELRRSEGFLQVPGGVPAAPHLQTELLVGSSAEASNGGIACNPQPELAHHALQTFFQQQRVKHEAAVTAAAQLLDPLAKLRLLQALQQQQEPAGSSLSQSSSAASAAAATSSTCPGSPTHPNGGIDIALMNVLRGLSINANAVNGSGGAATAPGDAYAMPPVIARRSMDAMFTSMAAPCASQQQQQQQQRRIPTTMQVPSSPFSGEMPANLARRSIDIGALSRSGFEAATAVAHDTSYLGAFASASPPSAAAGAAPPVNAPSALGHRSPDVPPSNNVTPAPPLFGSLPTVSYMNFAAGRGEHSAGTLTASSSTDVAASSAHHHFPFAGIISSSPMAEAGQPSGMRRSFDGCTAVSASTPASGPVSAGGGRRSGSGSMLQSIAEADPSDYEGQRNGDSASSSSGDIPRSGSASSGLDGPVDGGFAAAAFMDGSVSKELPFSVQRVMSFDNILAELPRSSSQVNMIGVE